MEAKTKGQIMVAGYSIAQVVAAGCLIALGFAHSALGEASLLRPLFAKEWELSEVPRWAAERIFRFAWHITSIAWLALAAIVLDANALVVVGVMSVVTGAIIFFSLPGHLAWPLFLLGGLAAFRAEGSLGEAVLEPATYLTVALLLGAAAVHVYWAAGGRWMLDRAAPKVEESNFSPGPVLTLMVAVALATFAALIVLASRETDLPFVRWLVMAGVGVFTIRAIGDTKLVGLTKTVHDTDFGKADDAYFTPLIVLIALGATGSLLI